jgi:hypothetical protein
MGLPPFHKHLLNGFLNRSATLEVCRYAEELANVLVLCTKKPLRIALSLLPLPLHYSVALAERLFLFPRFVLNNEKLLTTVLARRSGEEDRAAWPKI